MKRKNVIFGSVIFILLCVFVVLFFFQKKSIKPLVLFYNVPSFEQDLLKNIIKDNFINKADIEDNQKNFDGLPVEFVSIDKNSSILDFLNSNNVLLVISKNYNKFFAAKSLFESFTKDEFINLPSTFQKNIFGNEYSAYPFLLDTYEFCYNNNLFKSQDVDYPKNIDELEDVLLKFKNLVNYPFVFAGADDDTLLYFITSLMNLNGKIIQSEEFNEFIHNSEIQKNIPISLKNVLDVLISWRKKGLLHPEWFRLVDKDVEIFMEFKNTAVSFMSLSQHRSMKKDALSNFFVMPILTPTKIEAKNIPAKCFFIAKVKKDGVDENNLDLKNNILHLFTSNEGQSRISKIMGLAPTNSSAKVYDLQASNARYWVASSNMIIPDFSEIIGNLTNQEKANLIKTIRLYIEVNGIGF